LDAQYGDFVQLFNRTLVMTDEVKAGLNKVLTETKEAFRA